MPILPALDLGGYKDELNLAEFPIAALTDRVPDGQTTLVFEDKLDQKDGPPIIRRLTIMAPSKHGLPTAMDDEVMVGLIQLTKRRNNYTDPKVAFSRYELIELLGWPQNGQSYQRIEEALHRWVGVVLMYENAWWDNSAKSWVDENFHILENVSLYDRERRRRAGKAGAKASPRPGAIREGDPLPLSSFRWNEVIFRSFQSGNLKQLDLEFYLQLRLPTTKRHVPLPRQAVLPPRPPRFRPEDARMRAHRHEPILQADRVEAPAAARARGAGDRWGSWSPCPNPSATSGRAGARGGSCWCAARGVARRPRPSPSSPTTRSRS